MAGDLVIFYTAIGGDPIIKDIKSRDVIKLNFQNRMDFKKKEYKKNGL